MMFFRNLKLAHKLLASFIALLLLTAGLGLFSVVQLDRVNRTATDLAHHWMPAERVIMEMRYQLQRYRSQTDRKSTRLNSSHLVISYAVFCLKKKKIHNVWDLRADTHNHYH